MKLIIQIPCLNEEQTLPVTLKDLPKEIEGVDIIETLVIDDGSTDNTIETARNNGVNHIIKFTNNKGLAEAFMAGLDASLKLGADIVVNTDGDNQYNGEDIEKLVQPIVLGEADFVVGDRQVNRIDHFSGTKKKLQVLGSWVVKQVSNTDVPDATSGFRAISREAALKMNVITKFSYTLETIIQAGKKNLAVSHVPVSTQEKLRESRLFKSIPSYIKRSMLTIFRIYLMYEPLKTFLRIGGIVFGSGMLISGRFLYFWMTGNGGGHIQSLILSAVLMMIGFQVIMIGLVADLIGGNRRLIEDALYRVKKIELNQHKGTNGKHKQNKQK
ncbi:glycosyl transferase [candidate division KSB1 bacterium 4572_119]|nr:MAG: glycosyl transferase [candidate division KSB1 bacterium 4572_119]